MSPWSPSLPEGRESQKVKYDVVEWTRGRGLDLGCGLFKPFSHWIGVDQGMGRGVDLVMDASDLSIFQDNSMDFVFSSHLLEHMVDPKAVLHEWFRVVKPGGYVVLYLPHADLYPRIGNPEGNPDHKFDFYPEDIKALVPTWSSVLVWDEVRDSETEYSFLQVYRKGDDVVPPGPSPGPYPKEGSVAVVRYGGFGDMLQAATLLPKLKMKYSRLTFYTTPEGRDILEGNPYIDSYHIQDRGQVPPEELPNFWWVHAHRYEKFINLSESVEGNWLALPGRSNHAWPAEVRRKYLGRVNYLEFQHELAGIDYAPKDVPSSVFYTTPEEDLWVIQELESIPRPRILWVLAGSSVHKTWPGMDSAIASIMLHYPGMQVVLCGDESCKLLERGWEEESRVHLRSGVWSIRKTLAIASHFDLVIGPETGVMNHLAFHPTPKVIFLSHSSEDNLTRDWLSTTTVIPSSDCYPCHSMHYNFNFCHRDSRWGVSSCMASISPADFWFVIRRHLDTIYLKNKGG